MSARSTMATASTALTMALAIAGSGWAQTAKLDCNQDAPNALKTLGEGYQYAMLGALPTETVDSVSLRDSHTNNCACCPDVYTYDPITNVVRARMLTLAAAPKASGSSS